MTKPLPTNTIPAFLWSIIKPYKWWYLLMMQAPFVNCTYKIFSTFAVKLVVDAFTSSAIPEYSDFIFPITVFISSILIMEMGWRVSHFAWMKSQPFVRTNIVARSYDYIQNHSYVFFQNTHSGSILSKIKGILAGYNNLWFGFHHRLRCRFSKFCDGDCARIHQPLALYFHGFVVLSIFSGDVSYVA
ncbi:MAG: hypothetical protein KGP29_07120 [Proteobacteria bacterium]|nr:hypothetical protein [Pseudomonadota bacterium]